MSFVGGAVTDPSFLLYINKIKINLNYPSPTDLQIIKRELPFDISPVNILFFAKPQKRPRKFSKPPHCSTASCSFYRIQVRAPKRLSDSPFALRYLGSGEDSGFQMPV